MLGEEKSRRTYLADSFAGIPSSGQLAYHPVTGYKFSLKDRHANHPLFAILNNNSVDWVQRDAERFHLSPHQLRWVAGFFNESLPRLFAAEPTLQFAVVRLDGDAYHSTWDAITELYPRLAPGGFIIIDDFTEWEGCRKAVLDYRKRNKITEPLTLIPHRYGEVHIGAYWRKASASKPDLATCIGAGDASRDLRATNSYLPTKLTLLQQKDFQPSSKERVVMMPNHMGPLTFASANHGSPVHFCAGGHAKGNDAFDSGSVEKGPVKWINL